MSFLCRGVVTASSSFRSVSVAVELARVSSSRASVRSRRRILTGSTLGIVDCLPSRGLVDSGSDMLVSLFEELRAPCGVFRPNYSGFTCPQ